MMRFVGPLLLCAFAALPRKTSSALSNSSGGVNNEEMTIFLDASHANSLLRKKRGWWNRGEEREEDREDKVVADTNRFCASNCWAPWTSWTSCSVRCGSSGVSTRSRAALGRRPRPPPPPPPRDPCEDILRPRLNDGMRKPQIRQRLVDARKRPCRMLRSVVSSAAHKTRMREKRAVAYLPTKCNSWATKYRCLGTTKMTRICNRSCRNGGQLLSTSCKCKTGFKGTCCEHRVTCMQPPENPHSQLSPKLANYQVGARVSYSCQSSYQVVGASTSVCMNTGRWTNTAPLCNLRKCSDPGVPANGRRDGNMFTLGSSVAFHCNQGFYRIGASSITCRKTASTTSWTTTKPSCKAVTCPVLNLSPGVIKSSNSVAFNILVLFSCVNGRNLIGSQQTRCQHVGTSGVWSSQPPTCRLVMCAAFAQPARQVCTFSTAAAFGKYSYGTTSTCHCGSGYVGTVTRKCESNGQWSGIPVVCRPVSCGDPGTPQKGSRAAVNFNFPSVATFRCHPGYVLVGPDRRSCQSNGKWSGSPSSCSPCPKNKYKIGDNSLHTCNSCPANSHTTGIAATNLLQCLCNVKFKKSPTGTCIEKQCPALNAIANGQVLSCPRVIGSECRFACNSGHRRSRGVSVRNCLNTERWSGEIPVCEACPQHYYRSSESQCSLCPDHSSTVSAAQEKTGCRCDAGFTGSAGGPCSDIDECAAGNGGCTQQCQNQPGYRICECNIPGFVQDKANEENCIATGKCDNPSPPDNSGFICLKEQNNLRCQFKCNDGFDHFEDPSVFETCGPDTNWEWIARDKWLPCIALGFVDTISDVSTAYWVTQCQLLTELQLQAAKQAYLEELRQHGVCLTGCKLEDMSVTCGPIAEDDWGDYGRRKRSTVTGVGFRFRIVDLERSVSSAQCDTKCRQRFHSNNSCARTCRHEYHKSRKHFIKMQSEKVFQLATKRQRRSANPGNDGPTAHLLGKLIYEANFRARGGSSKKGLSQIPTKIPTNIKVTVATRQETGECRKEEIQTKDELCAQCPKSTVKRGNKCVRT